MPARHAQEMVTDLVGPALILDAELRELLPLVAAELGSEGGAVGRGIRFYRPVFASLEGFDFGLPLCDKAECRALYTPGRQAATNLLPQQGRQIESHQVVEGPTSLLCVDKRR